MGRARDNAAPRRSPTPPPPIPLDELIAKLLAARAKATRYSGAHPRGEGMDGHDELLDQSVRAPRQATSDERARLWETLLATFRHRRPDAAEMAELATLAEVAIDQVFAAHHTSDSDQARQHGQVKDFADCAALYGYALGYRRALERRAS